MNPVDRNPQDELAILTTSQYGHILSFSTTSGLAGQENKPIEKRDLERAKRKGIANKRWPDGIVYYKYKDYYDDFSE